MPALTGFLEIFRKYHEGSHFRIITDIQILQFFLDNPVLCRIKERWIKTFGTFGMFVIALKPGKIHAFEDTLSRTPNDRAVVNKFEIPYVNFSKVINGYDDYQCFRTTAQALNGLVIRRNGLSWKD